jgi:DNA-binding MarR family transcriptional regulator
MSVEKLLDLVRFIRSIESEFPAQHLHALLVVAAKAPISLGEVAREVGLSKASLSRILDKMSDKGIGQADGLGLLKAERDPKDDRFILLRLSQKGETVVKTLNLQIGR